MKARKHPRGVWATRVLGAGGSIGLARSGLPASGLGYVKRPVFPSKLRKWKVFFPAEVEIAITFLTLSGSRYSAEILLWGPGSGLVSFALLWAEVRGFHQIPSRSETPSRVKNY